MLEAVSAGELVTLDGDLWPRGAQMGLKSPKGFYQPLSVSSSPTEALLHASNIPTLGADLECLL